MTERDADQAWLDALAGRGGGDEEAERLREGILARKIEEPPFVPAVDPRREDELIARARRAGLLPKARPLSWIGWQGLAALASAASVLLVLGFLLRRAPSPPPATVRAAPGGIVRIESHDAHALQHQIADELQAAGVPSILYDRLNTYGIDADLPSPVPPEVLEILRRHGIAPPGDGALEIEIAEPPGR